MSGDYEKALQTYRDLVESRMSEPLKGKANPYTSLNGNMFSFLGKDGVIALRLSDADYKAYQERFGGGPVISYGAVMKGYVAVTEDLLADEAALSEVLAQCLSYARALPAKPTKKK